MRIGVAGQNRLTRIRIGEFCLGQRQVDLVVCRLRTGDFIGPGVSLRSFEAFLLLLLKRFALLDQLLKLLSARGSGSRQDFVGFLEHPRNLRALIVPHLLCPLTVRLN